MWNVKKLKYTYLLVHERRCNTKMRFFVHEKSQEKTKTVKTPPIKKDFLYWRYNIYFPSDMSALTIIHTELKATTL